MYNSTDAIVFSVQSLSKNLSKTLEILQERMLRPKFTEEAFSRLKRQTIERIKNAKSQASSVANVVFDKINYGNNNVFGISDRGTEETVKNITLSDIQNYYDQYISSNGAQVVVVGNVKEKDVLPQLNF